MIHDPAQVRLGRKPPRLDPRTLKLSSYLMASQLPKAPPVLDNGSKVQNWQVFMNNSIGDCTVAGLLHMIMLWQSLNGETSNFSDADALALYEQLCGYVPGKPDTDQGGVELDILNAWRKTPIKGCTLQAYVSVNPKNWAQVKLASFLFGTLYMGLALPTSAQNEEVWSSTTDTPGSWGGHAVAAIGYDDNATCLTPSTLTCVTWGETKKMTRSWLATYCDELYAPLSPTWLGTDNLAPNGLNGTQLAADLAEI